MGVSNGKITRPVSISDVSTAVGLNSSDLGQLIARAKSGGRNITVGGMTFPVAYYIKEINDGGGVTGYTGVGFENAVPYHNIYSRGATHWEKKIKTSGSGEILTIMEVFNRINRNPNIPSAVLTAMNMSYTLNLHDFDGYDNNATAPRVYLENPVILGYPDDMPKTSGFNVMVDPGQIDWQTLTELANPHAGAYRVELGGTNINLPNLGEYGTVALSLNTVSQLGVLIDTSRYFSDAGTYNLNLELKIGNTENFVGAFRIDRWFTVTIPVKVGQRPFVNSDFRVFIDGEKADQLVLGSRNNFKPVLYQGAGGSWTGTGSYTGVKIDVTGEVIPLLYNSLTVSWYVTNQSYDNQSDITTNGKLMKTATYVYTSSTMYTQIGINGFSLSGWTLTDGQELFVWAIVTNYT